MVRLHTSGDVGNFIKSSRNTKILGTASIAGLFALSVFLFNPVVDTVDDASATTGAANSSTTTLTLSFGHSTASVTATAIDANGTFISSDANGKAAFTVSTNNYTGYELSIVGSDDTGNLSTVPVSGGDPETISSISEITSATDFSVSSASSLNNKWGFAPSKYINGSNVVVDNTGANQVFLPAPTTTPTQLDKTTSANATDNEYTLSLGVRVDYTTPSGVYANTFTLVALANPTPYEVTFDKNTNDTVTNMPSVLDSSTSLTGINIPNTTPVRANYTFVGWCNRKDALNTCPTGGTTYQPNATYGIDQTADNTGVTLYAMWQPNYYMQDVATWGSNLAVGESVQAIDRRDNKIYWVTKEETDPANPRAEFDEITGKAYQIWMTQNLDLDLVAGTKTYTHEDTDLGYTSNNPNASWTPQAQTLTDVADWDSTITTDQSVRNSNYYYPTDPTEVTTEYTSLTNCTGANILAEECAHFKAGTLYNSSLAMAETATDTLAISDVAYSAAPNSICPAGWRLPTGSNSDGTVPSDYGFLLYKNGVTNGLTGGNGNPGYTENGLSIAAGDPIWAGRIGRANNGEYNYLAGSSYIRYSTIYNTNNSFGSDLGLGTYASTDATPYRTWGIAVRCVARPVKSMQNVDLWQDELAINETVQAVDNRDNKVYWITKEETDPASPDAAIDEDTGKSYQLFMTQNLAYDLNTGSPLIPTNSDVTESWTTNRTTIVKTNYSQWQANSYGPYSYNPGDDYWYTSGDNSSSTDNIDYHYTSMSDCMEANHTAVECSHYRSGNYYNWAAAIAVGNTRNYDAKYEDVVDSICPAGWRLPHAAHYRTDVASTFNYGDYNYLLKHHAVIDGYLNGNVDQYEINGLNIIRDEPLWLVRAALFDGGESVSNETLGAGYYWSSTPMPTTDATLRAKSLAFTPSVVSTSNQSTIRESGLSVRCVARTDISNISTLQKLGKLDSTEKKNTIKNMEVGEIYQLEDSRDGETYDIAKLADGHVWMLDNLRLDLTTTTTLTPSDTNITSDWNVPASINSWSDSYEIAKTFNTIKNTDQSYGEGTTKAGVFYNYCAATAGTYCYNSLTGTGDANYDICPAGWRMPTGGPNGEYQELQYVYNSTSALRDALRLPLTGYVENSQVNGQDVRGDFWSLTKENAYRVYGLIVDSSTTYPQALKGRAYGFSVRCILDDTEIADIDTMQDFNNLSSLSRKNVLASMVSGKQYTLTDSRDNNEYTIARLIDGTVWMTQNLNLAGGTALYSDDTNVPEGYPVSGNTPYYTLPASDTNGFDDNSRAFVYNSDTPQSECGQYTDCASYYSYAAATAGTNPNTGDAVYDICPKGWRLPTISEYSVLSSLYQGSTGHIDLTGPWHGEAYGRYANSTFYDSAGHGVFFWSATSKDNISANNFYFQWNYSSTSESSKMAGIPVRCVLNTYIQDATPDTLALLVPTLDSKATFTDKRDNERYVVSRLRDNKVWMLENMRLGGSSTLSLTPSDTNISSNFTLPASINSGFGSFTAAQINADSKYSSQSYGDGNGKIGVYYNYCAASAGTICADDNSEDATSDICPRGWRIPTGGDNGEYETLYIANNLSSGTNDSNFKNSLRTPYSGRYSSNTTINQGTVGYYWASNNTTSTYMGALSVYSSDVTTPKNSDNRSYGQSVRCIKSN